jgi:hypothetical protein
MPTSSREAILYDFINSNELISLNSVRNAQGNTLDLVLTNTKSLTVSIGESVVKQVDKYHPPLQLNLQLKSKTNNTPNNKTTGGTKVKKVNKEKQEMLCYAKADFEQIYKSVKSKCWRDLYTIQDPNKAAEYFQNAMNELILSSVPTKTINRNKNKYPPWYTETIIKTLKAKERERRKLKKSKITPIDDSKYRTLRAIFKKQTKTAYNEYLTHTERKLAENPRDFWKFIKQKKNQKFLVTPKIQRPPIRHSK